ncbi:preprotein translocase subunit SecE [bacterium]|nr:preprotein translocase subunit SecE [bacterium]
MANRLIQYVRDTRAELKHVSWPTQKQTVIFTVLVIIISLLVAFFLGAFDYIFTGALNLVI